MIENNRFTLNLHVTASTSLTKNDKPVSSLTTVKPLQLKLMIRP